jgi:hypothetical protein
LAGLVRAAILVPVLNTKKHVILSEASGIRGLQCPGITNIVANICLQGVNSPMSNFATPPIGTATIKIVIQDVFMTQ